MKFERFEVTNIGDEFIFVSPNLDDLDLLSSDLFSYFFEEGRLYKYFQCLEENSFFKPEKSNYAALYRNLSYFFDDDDEPIANEKAGKTGEYFLSILLMEYFGFDCILPKLIYITDQDMPVYGIDTLFYSSYLDLFVFGEAKFTKNLHIGIELINKSLSEYEKQFDDEFRFIVQNHGFSKSKNPNLQKYGKCSEEAINFKTFIKDSKITEILIPLFICHGEENDIPSIMKKMTFIEKQNRISGLLVKYLVISLPVTDKNEILKRIKERLIEKQLEYETICTK